MLFSMLHLVPARTLPSRSRAPSGAVNAVSAAADLLNGTQSRRRSPSATSLRHSSSAVLGVPGSKAATKGRIASYTLAAGPWPGAILGWHPARLVRYSAARWKPFHAHGDTASYTEASFKGNHLFDKGKGTFLSMGGHFGIAIFEEGVAYGTANQAYDSCQRDDLAGGGDGWQVPPCADHSYCSMSQGYLRSVGHTKDRGQCLAYGFLMAR